jgi:hypothetical protein
LRAPRLEADRGNRGFGCRGSHAAVLRSVA